MGESHKTSIYSVLKTTKLYWINVNHGTALVVSVCVFTPQYPGIVKVEDHRIEMGYVVMGNHSFAVLIISPRLVAKRVTA